MRDYEVLGDFSNLRDFLKKGVYCENNIFLMGDFSKLTDFPKLRDLLMKGVYCFYRRFFEHERSFNKDILVYLR